MTDRVDLNCDMGESFGAYRIGADDDVFPFITSANVACGFHGGDPTVMRTTLEKAKQRGVGVGAHPGFPDLIGFGRRNMDISPDDVYDLVVYQVGALLGFARAGGIELQHVKPHGALYNMAAAKRELASAIANAVRDVDRDLVLFGLPGNPVVVMVTFIAFVRPALLRMMGARPEQPVMLRAVSEHPIRKKPGRTEYQRGIVTQHADGRLTVRLTGNQGSGVLSSMIQANGLIVLGHQQGAVKAGEEVSIMMLNAA